MLNSIHLDIFQFQNRATTLGYDLRCGSFYSPDLDNPALWWIHLSFALNLVLTYYYFSVHGRHLGPYSHVWTLSKRIPCLLHPVTLRELFLTFWQLLCWQGISFILFCDLGRTPESIEDPWINGQDLNFFHWLWQLSCGFSLITWSSYYLLHSPEGGCGGTQLSWLLTGWETKVNLNWSVGNVVRFLNSPPLLESYAGSMKAKTIKIPQKLSSLVAVHWLTVKVA